MNDFLKKENNSDKTMKTKRKKNFVCAECNKCFIDNAHLREHQIKHTKEKLFVCTVCNKKFARSNSLRVHSKSHTEGTQEYVCPYDDCCRKYSSRSGFIYHQRKHNELQNLSMKQSQVSLIPNSQKTQTVPYCIPNQSELDCPFSGCNKSFVNESSYNTHVYGLHLGTDLSVCSRTQCIQLRKDYLQQKILIQRLQERIKELEALTSHCNQAECEEFQLEYQKQSEESIIPVIPEYYLEEEKPYICGITECSQRFSTLKLLKFHGRLHPSIPIDRVLNNQLSIPSGPVYCPVAGCEYDKDHKPMASFFVLKRHYRRVHQKEVGLIHSIPDLLEQDHVVMLDSVVINPPDLHCNCTPSSELFPPDPAPTSQQPTETDLGDPIAVAVPLDYPNETMW